MYIDGAPRIAVLPRAPRRTCAAAAQGDPMVTRPTILLLLLTITARPEAVQAARLAPPVITALTASSLTAHPGDVVALSTTATDAASRTLSYAWTARPLGCGTISTPRRATASLTAVVPGSCTVKVKVTAGSQSTSRSVTIDVVAPEPGPPVISALTAAPLTAHPGDLVSLSLTATDPASRPLAYAWTALPAGCGTFSAPAAAASTLTAVLLGSCTVTATATAGTQSASRSVVLSVVAPNSGPPVISALTASPATTHPGDLVALSVTATDPASRPLSYAWATVPEGCGAFSSTTAAATILTAVSVGTCSVQVTVMAGTQSASAVVDIAVFAPGSTVPTPMPRVAYSYSALTSSGATTPAAAISGLGPSVVWWSRAGDTSAWAGDSQDGYDERIANDPATNVPSAYVIEASANGGGAWTTLVAVIGNTYMVRGHLVDLTGYTSVRMRLTSAPLHSGSVYLGVDFAVHDARLGHDDWWLALGDSLTTNIWNVYDPLKFGSRVHARAPQWFPVADEGGVSGGYIADFLRTNWAGNPDGRTIMAQWMADFPGKYVILAIGQNDTNAGTNTDTMEAGFRKLLNTIVAAGKTPVVPTLRWTYTNGATSVANIQAWNARLVTIRASYPTVITGPDVYTRAAALGLAGLMADRTHCNEAGATLTQEDWLLWALASIYTGP
jgi:hypothetical protein